MIVNEWLQTHSKSIKQFIVFSFAMISMQVALANPEGGVVTSGTATITQAPNVTQINQATDKAIIEWNSFNIGAQEKTQFIQPNSSSITLNRINPNQGASQIFGQLSANGRIVLVNQAGIFFGPSAVVDVSGIIASTSNITNANFLADKFIFDQPGTFGGSIINQGTIIAANHGLVALAANNVRNDGSIQANLGSVVLASGNKFTVDLQGDQLINFTVDEASTQTGLDENQQAMRDGVRNNGAIMADGGKIIISARAAEGVVDNVINMKGVAQAHSVSQQKGVIILDGGEGTVRVSGNLNASGKGAAQKGGTIKVLAKQVYLEDQAMIDASGTFGGGEILIGGNFQGSGPEPHALNTYVHSGAVLNADALSNGDGGKIIVWSDGWTGFDGTISARGGVYGGNGGFAETSGHVLSINGTVDTRAPFGIIGNWLLDPTNIYIALNQTNANNAGMSGSNTSVNSSDPTTFAASTNVTDSLLTTATLTSALASSNVTVTTVNASAAAAGNIIVVDPITWSTTTTLTLNAENNIYFYNANSSITALNGGLTLNTRSALLDANRITITSGNASTPNTTTGVLASINVANFNLAQGGWRQVNAALPTFNVSNNFQISGGTIVQPNSTAQFLRVSGGAGTVGSPYELKDIFGLQGVGSVILNSHYKLMNDIDASLTRNWNSGAGFYPISSRANSYSGIFNGNGYTIDKLFMNVATDINADVGLFSQLNGTITNLGVTNAEIHVSSIQGGTDFQVGVIAARTNAGTTLSNVFSTGSLDIYIGQSRSGGLVGLNNGNISSSYSTVNVTFNKPTNTDFINIGGLVGYNSGTGTIATSYSAGNVTSNSGNAAISMGGFVGNTANTNSTAISDSYSFGNVSNTSTATSTTTRIGGFVGDLGGAAVITRTYSTGRVSTAGTSNKIGGFIGEAVSPTGLSLNFWDTDTSLLGSAGVGSITTGQVIGKTTSQLMTYSTYTGNSWNTPSTTITNTGFTGTTPPAVTWLMIDGKTRPMLRAEWSTTLKNPHQLQLMSTALDASYSLAQNIDLNAAMSNQSEIWGTNKYTGTGVGFYPIGANVADFTGDLNGNSYSIDNLYIKNSSAIAVGFFSTVGTGSSIQNLGLTNIDITDTLTATIRGVGGLTGGALNTADITKVFTTGRITVTGDSYRAGGLIGLLNNTASVTKSYSLVNLLTNLTTNSFGVTGGLIGSVLGGTVSENYSGGTVKTVITNLISNQPSFSYIGGLIGESSAANVSNNYSYANVSSNYSGSLLGGFIGKNSGTISTSYSSGSVTGNASVKGFAGDNSGTFTNNFWDTDTSGTVTGSGGTTTGLTGKTTTLMKDFSTYSAWGANINSTISLFTAAPSGTWFIFDDKTRPILISEWNQTISNPHQLQLAGMVLGASYTLAKNIELNSSLSNASDIWATSQGAGIGAGFVPIGNRTNAFTGTFNGANYTINDLYINLTSDINSNVGLFGNINNALTSLGVTNARIYIGSTQTGGSVYSGILAGQLGSAGSITKSYTSGTITSTVGNSITGGFVGSNGGTISKSYNSAAVTIDSTTGTVDIGGFAGYNETTGKISESYNNGNVVGRTGNVAMYMGGFVGTNTGITSGGIYDSYNVGNISYYSTNSSGYLGGFAGRSITQGIIHRSYSSGTISSPGNTIANYGGFLGISSSVNYFWNFWDSTTSGLNSGSAGGGTPSNVNPLTTDQMKTTSSFSSLWGSLITDTGFSGNTAPNATWIIFEGYTRPMLQMEWSTSITNPHQLQLAHAALNANYTLKNNIDLTSSLNNTSEIWATNQASSSGRGFKPIGYYSDASNPTNTLNAFTGSFNGNNYNVNNLYINQAADNYGTGLFGAANLGVNKIVNVGLSNATVLGGHVSGILIGLLTSGAISNVYSSGSVLGQLNGASYNAVGGLIGVVDTTNAARNLRIDNVYSTASVVSNTNMTAGGLIGFFGRTGVTGLSLTLNNSYSTGLVSTSSSNKGGLIGVLGGIASGTNNFWDTATSGISTTTTIATGKTTAQMMTPSTFASWSISSTPSTFTTPENKTWLMAGSLTRPMLASEWNNSISSPHQLQLMDMASGANYQISNDINLLSAMNNIAEVWGTNQAVGIATSGSGFKPIGTYSGFFDGQYHFVSNLYINNSSTTNSGLFTATDTPATIQNIALPNATVYHTVTGGRNLGILVGDNLGKIYNAFSSGQITSTSTPGSIRIGGLVGENGLVNGNDTYATVMNSFSNASVVTQGTSGYFISGGVVGRNDGIIANLYSTGTVVNTTGSAAGGVVGENFKTATSIFYDSSTSGLTGGGTAGCFTGISCTSGSANLSSASTFTGWDFTSNWGIIEGLSYPFLKGFYSSTPRAISGTFAGDTGGTTITLASNGTNLTTSGLNSGTIKTGKNGFYYFIFNNNYFADGAALLSYISGGAANAVTAAPSAGGSINGFNLTTNTVNVGSSVSQVLPNTNTLLGNADNNISASDILYTTVGTALTLDSGISLNSTANTTYTIDGNITASGAGTLLFNGPIVLSANTVLTTANNSISLLSTISNAIARNLTITAGIGNITLGGNIGTGTALGAITLNSTSSTTNINGTINAASLTTDVSGTTNINSSSITTSGNQIYNDATQIGANTTLTTTNSSSKVEFNDYLTSNNHNNLTISTGASGNINLTVQAGQAGPYLGVTTLNSSGTTNLSSISAISITTDAPGSTVLNGSITLNGGALTFNDPVNLAQNISITTNGANATFASPLNSLTSNSLTISAGAGNITMGSIGDTNVLSDLTLSGSIISLTNVALSGLLTATNTADSNITGVISGATALTKSGTGKLTLGSANTFTGKTIINNGTLAITTLQNTNSGTPSSLGNPNANSTIDINSTGILQYIGTASDSNRTINIVNTGGTIDASGSGTLVLTGNITGSSTGLVLTGTGAGTVSITGSINGTITTVTKNNSGTWNFGGANSYTGITTINSGTLNVENSNSLGTTGSGTVVNSTGILSLVNVGNFAAEPITLNSGTLTSLGTSALSAAITFGGPSTIQTTTLGTLTLNSGATINNNGNLMTFNVGVGATINGNSVISGALGGLTKTGPGLLTLSAVNTFTGKTTINAGTISVNSLTFAGGGNSALGNPAGSTSDIDINSTGVLKYTGGANTTNRGINITGSGGTVDVSGSGTLTLAGSITGVTSKDIVLTGTGTADVTGSIFDTIANITKNGSGTWTFNNNNIYTGTTTINAGLLSLFNSNITLGTSGAGTIINGGILRVNALTISGEPITLAGGSLETTGTTSLSGAITLSSAGTIKANSGALSLLSGATINTGGNALTFDTNTGTISAAGIISGTGTLTKTGSSTLTLSGLNTYTGKTTISAGSLSINTLGNLSASSALGAPTLAASGTIDIGGSSAVTLTYTGATTSTNRQINLVGAGGGIINVPNAGVTLTLAGNIDGAAPLNLTGSLSSNITLSGLIGSVTPPTLFTVDLPITINTSSINTNGTQTYNRAVNLTAASSTLQTVSSGNIILGNNTSTTTLNSNTLSLNSIGNITFNGPISGAAGSLNLSAANSAASITTGASGTIDVNNFNLTQGQWNQVLASLPAFIVRNNFQLNTGVTPVSTVQFIRATSGDGTIGNKYVLTDIYGIQGIGSNSTTLAANYLLANNVDASSTSTWNSGFGFIPIGSRATNFTGSFNGQNNTINGLTINATTSTVHDIGLFGNSNGAISNVGVTNANIDVSNVIQSGNDIQAGILVGALNSSGTISNSYTSGTIDATNFTPALRVRMGGFAGQVAGTISDSYTTAAVTVNDSTPDTNSFLNVGGFVGYLLSGTISRSYTTGNVSVTTGAIALATDVGGFAGANSSTAVNTGIIDSYSLSNVTSNVTSGTRFTGGFVGDNFTSGAIIKNSYSTGRVSGNGVLGGFAGNLGGTNSLVANFWDSSSSGQSVGIGAGATGNVTAGCFTGVGCLSGSANLSAASTFTGAGWNFTTPWSIVEGKSYPYLKTIYTSTPRVISGTITGDTGGTVVTLAQNGANLVSQGLTVGSVQTGANGFFYFLEGNGSIADGNALIAYLASGSANAVTLAPSSGGSISGLDMIANTVSVGDSSPQTISNTNLLTAKGNLTTGMLYSTTGSPNITISDNKNFRTTSTTTYNLNGNINAGGTGTLTFKAPVSLSTNSVLTTINQAISFEDIISGAFNLTLNAGTSGSINLLGAASLNSLTANASTISLKNVTTTAAQSYTGVTTLNGTYLTASGAFNVIGAALLGNTTTIDTTNVGGSAGATISFNNSINNAQDLTLTAGTGAVSISGAVGGTAPLASLIASGATISLANVKTTGAQTYSGTTTLNGTNYITAGGTFGITGATSLGADTTVDTTNANAIPTGANISFSGSINNAKSLTLNAGTNNDITLSSAVGNSAALSSLSATARNISALGVHTTGLQSYTGSVNTTFNGTYTSGGTLSVSGPLTLAGATTIDTTNGGLGSGQGISLAAIISATNALTLNGGSAGAITASSFGGNGNLTLTNSFGTTFSGAVNATTVALTNTASAQTIAFNGGLTATTLTTFNQPYNLRINSGGTITNAVNFLNSGTLALGNGGSMTFSGGYAAAGNGSNPSSTSLNGTLLSSGNNQLLGTTIITGDTVLNSGNGNITLGTTNSLLAQTNNLTLTAGSGTLTLGSIGSTAALNTFTASNIGATNDVTISNAINTSGSINLTAGRNIILSTGNLTSLLGGAINLTASAGTISETGSSIINGGLLTMNSVGGMTLNNANLVSSLNATNATSGNISFTNANAIILTGINQTVGNFSLTTGGAITQSGSLTVNGTNAVSSFTAGSGNDVTLNNASNDFSRLAIVSGKDISVTDTNALSLAASTISGNFTIATSGDLTQVGALSVNGASKTATFAVGSGNALTLNNASNDFTRVVVTSANNVSLTDANALVLGPSSISGNLSLTTSGNITQDGAISASAVTINAGIGDVTLSNVNNNFTSVIASANSLTLKDVDNLSLGAINTTSDLSVIVGGSLTSTDLIQTAGGNVNLATTSAGSIHVIGDIKTSLDQISAGGSINITAANEGNSNPVITIDGILNTQGGSGGQLTIGGGIQINQSPVLGAGNIALQGNSTSTVLANLTLTSATMFDTNNTDFIINGPITATCTFPCVGGANLSFLADTGGIGVGGGGVRVTSTGSVVTDGYILMKGSDLISNPGTSIQLDAGSILQAAGTISLISNTGTTTPANSNIVMNGSIQAGQTVTLTPDGTGHIQLSNSITTTSASPIVLNNPVFLTGNTTLTTVSGNITMPGVFTGSNYALTIDVGNSTDIDFTNVGNNFGTIGFLSARNVNLTDINSIILGASTLAGNLTIASNGAITQSDIVSADLATFTAGSANAITLSLNNNFNTLKINSASNVNINDVSALALDASTISGNLSVTTAGNMTQNGALAVTGNSTFDSGSANINLTTNGTNNVFGGSVGLTSSGNATLTDNSALLLANSTIGGTLTLIAAGNLTQNAPLTANNLIATINGSITLSDTTNSISNLGNISRNGAFTLLNTSALNINGSLALGTINNAITINTSFTPSGLLTINGDIATSGANNISLTGNGITLIAGKTINAGSGTITLDADGAAMQLNTGSMQTTNTSSSSITIKNASTVALGNITTAGTLVLGLGDITGTVSQNAAINASALTTNTTGIINLNNTSNAISNLGEVTRGGAFTLNNTGDLAIVGNLNSGVTNNAIIIHATGDLSFAADAIMTATTAGDAINLSGNSFHSNTNVTLNTGGGRYLIWSSNPANDDRGALSYSFKQYNLAYGADPSEVLGTGNGFIYSIAPTITPSLISTVSKTYDGNNTATLSGSNYSFAGNIDGDTIVLNNPTSGTYNNKNVGTSKNVAVTGIAITSASENGATVYGYQVNSSANADIGTITQRDLNINGVTADNKTYDGTTTATLNTGSAALATQLANTGLISGDIVNLDDTNAIGNFINKNVATGKAITISGFSINGTDAGNYNLIQPLGVTADINLRTVNIDNVTANNKVYNADIDASLNVGSAALAAAVLPSNTGLISGDTVNLDSTNALGVFGNKNVGVAKAVTISGFTISGADANNYSLVQPLGVTANITTRNVTVENISTISKIYNADVNATLDTSIASLQTASGNAGFIATDTVNLDVTSAVGVYNNKNVGTGKAITISGLSISGSDATNYNLVQPTTVTGDITARSVGIELVTADNKVYDALTDATLNTTQAKLIDEDIFNSTGFIAGDVVNLISTAAVGDFINKNAGLNKSVIISGFTIDGSDANNYSLVQPIGVTADITPRNTQVIGVTADNKVYNALTNAVINTGSANLQGIISGDTVTLDDANAAGVFLDKNAGVAKTVSLTGFTMGGIDANNYNIVQPTGVTANITTRSVTIDGVAANDKIYNALTNAVLDTTNAQLTSQSGNTGFIFGDDVTLDNSAANGQFVNKMAGISKSVTITGFTIGGTDANNYSLVQPLGVTATISVRDVGISNVVVNDKIYDSTLSASLNLNTTTLTAASGSTGYIMGDTVTLDTTNAVGNFANKNVGIAKSVNVSGFDISGSDASNYNLIQPTGVTGNVTARNVTVNGVVAADKIYNANTNVVLDFAQTTLSPQSGTTGYIAGDIVNLDTTNATGAFANKNAGLAKSVTLSGFDINGADASNYNLIQPTNVTANIVKADLTISGTQATNKTYDATTVATLDTSSSTLFGIYSGDVVNLTGTGTGTFIDANVGSAIDVTANTIAITGTDAGNYNLQMPTGLTADITPANLIITANNASIIYNGTAYTGGNGVTYNGFVGGETASALSGSLFYTGTSQGAINPGTYDITPDGLSSLNYAIAFANGVLTINNIPPTPSNPITPTIDNTVVNVISSAVNTTNSPLAGSTPNTSPSSTLQQQFYTVDNLFTVNGSTYNYASPSITGMDGNLSFNLLAGSNDFTIGLNNSIITNDFYSGNFLFDYESAFSSNYSFDLELLFPDRDYNGTLSSFFMPEHQDDDDDEIIDINSIIDENINLNLTQLHKTQLYNHFKSINLSLKQP